ncbi:MAG: electron transport complex subunit E [Clostridium sp.]|jgi:electron transport complex protein RnfE|nr:electron transport complex subunit E [Clostridium sp.]
MNKYAERIYNGIWKENPIFVQMLGLCPTLAVTTSAINGLGMGLSTTAVLVAANALIAALRNLIPDRVRLPAEIVVVASFVTIIDMLMEGFVPSLYSALGIYIPLIVVNCIILGRAESYAMKNGVLLSIFDGIGMGLGFTVALVLIGAFRELLGSGMIFNIQVAPASYQPVSIFILAPGAFFVLSCLTALQNKLKAPCATNGSVKKEKKSGCCGDCASCKDKDAKKDE